MRIIARVNNTVSGHVAYVETNEVGQSLEIPAKSTGRGSAVNGGEMLFLALATCFCNDIYREASRRKLQVSSVDIMVSGDFGLEGEPASGITYEVSIGAPEHSVTEIQNLIQHVDQVAEVHNTLRKGVSVILKL